MSVDSQQTIKILLACATLLVSTTVIDALTSKKEQRFCSRVKNEGKIIGLEKIDPTKCSINFCVGGDVDRGFVDDHCEDVAAEWERTGGVEGLRLRTGKCRQGGKRFKNLSIADVQQQGVATFLMAICVNENIKTNIPVSTLKKFGIEAWLGLG